MRNIFNLIKHPFFSGGMVMVVGSNAVNFLNYLYHLVMIRMLDPANYGELAAIIALVGLLGVIPGSLNLVVIKQISSARTETEVTSLIGWLKRKILLVSLIFSLVIFITSPFISSFLNINRTIYLIFVAVSFIFSIQSLLNRSILQGLLKFKEIVVSMLVENLGKLLFGILLIYFGLQAGGAVVGIVVATILGWYITNIYLRDRVKQKSQVKIDFRQMLFFAIPVLVQSLSITSIYSSDVILVKHFFSSYDAGIYASLSTLGKIIFFGAGPIGAVMFPLVSQKESKGQSYKKVVAYSFMVTALLAVVVTLIYWLYPSFVISLFGKKYLEAASLLVWFGIFLSLFTMSSLLVTFHLS
ncbi:MAG: oligosaccharide flippase family protein, partial [Candidatus Daviesbacteria bacterium]|nr:oligosaccharide flippase family protein [Candidatus Daviesbacteria bacterium]